MKSIERTDNLSAQSAWRSPKSDPAPVGLLSPLGVTSSTEMIPDWVPTFAPPKGNPADRVFGVALQHVESAPVKDDDVDDVVLETLTLRPKLQETLPNVHQNKPLARRRWMPVVAASLVAPLIVVGPHWVTHPPQQVPEKPNYSTSYNYGDTNTSVEQPLPGNAKNTGPSDLPSEPSISFPFFIK